MKCIWTKNLRCRDCVLYVLIGSWASHSHFSLYFGQLLCSVMVSISAKKEKIFFEEGLELHLYDGMQRVFDSEAYMNYFSANSSDLLLTSSYIVK